MTREVSLTQGRVALVDDEDYELVMASGPWAASVRKRSAYVTNSKRQYLHTVLTGWSLVDHINGNGLDNRRANLRPATPSQNGANMRRPSNNTSGFKGVSYYRRTGTWVAKIYARGVAYNLGYHATAEAAARAYDAAAVRLHGSYARLNFPGETPGEMYIARSWSGRTECPRGHPYDEENTYLRQGRRQCRACRLTRRRELRKRKAAMR